MSALLFSLGRGPIPEGTFSVYALIDGSDVKEIFPADSPAQALDRALAISDAPPECGPQLQEAAEARGWTARELRPPELAIRAHLAIRVFAADLFPGIQSHIMAEFFDAAYIFQVAADRDIRQYHFRAAMQGQIGNEPVSETVAAVMNTGPAPSLWVMAESQLARLVEGSVPFQEIDLHSVNFADEPEAVVDALEDAYGLTGLPYPRGQGRFAPTPLDAMLIEKLAALLGVTGHYLSAQSPGMDWNPQLGGELRVRIELLGVAD
jgi:hypothetical protein